MKIKVILFLGLVVYFYGCSDLGIDNNTLFEHDKVISLYIQPLGEVDQELMDSIANKASTFYKMRVLVNESILIPKSFFINEKSPRYRADSIIRYLQIIKPDSIEYVIGITSQDVSTTKRNPNGTIKEPVHKYKDWGIFGLGFCPGPTCVVSTFRFGKDKQLKIERAQKVALHEIGHNLGLPHCPNLACFMQDGAESIKTVDNVQFTLCDACKEKIERH